MLANTIGRETNMKELVKMKDNVRRCEVLTIKICYIWDDSLYI